MGHQKIYSIECRVECTRFPTRKSHCALGLLVTAQAPSFKRQENVKRSSTNDQFQAATALSSTRQNVHNGRDQCARQCQRVEHLVWEETAAVPACESESVGQPVQFTLNTLEREWGQEGEGQACKQEGGGPVSWNFLSERYCLLQISLVFFSGLAGPQNISEQDTYSHTWLLRSSFKFDNQLHRFFKHTSVNLTYLWILMSQRAQIVCAVKSPQCADLFGL